MPSWKSCVAGLCVAISAFSSRAYAEEEAPPLHPLNKVGGVDVTLTFGKTATYLGDTTFHGSGRPLYGGDVQTFSASGKSLGFAAPSYLNMELELSYLRRYLLVGAFGAAGSGISPDRTPERLDLQNAISSAGGHSYAGGLQLLGVIPYEPVTMRFGARGGLRQFQLPITAYETKTCTTKGRSYPCAETADATVAFIEPRISVDVGFGKGLGALGAFATLDVMHAGVYSWGLTLSLRTPHWTLAP